MDIKKFKKLICKILLSKVFAISFVLLVLLASAALGIDCLLMLLSMYEMELVDNSPVFLVLIGIAMYIPIDLGIGFSNYVIYKCENFLKTCEEEDRKLECKEDKDLEFYNSQIQSLIDELEEKKDVKEEIDFSKSIAAFLENSKQYGLIKEEVFSEWQDYLNNTVVDQVGEDFVKILMIKLLLLEKTSLKNSLPELKRNEDMIDLLIYFGKKGDSLAKALNRTNTDVKKKQLKK